MALHYDKGAPITQVINALSETDPKTHQTVLKTSIDIYERKTGSPPLDSPDRVTDEMNELKAKICRLDDFLKSKEFENLMPPKQILLRKKRAAMQEYYEILYGKYVLANDI